jgi:hypothetical protein
VVLTNPSQALQVLLTQLLMGEGYAQRQKAVAVLLPHADGRRAFNLFMSALLARRLAAGWALDTQRLRTALEDAWTQPVIQRRWEQLVLRLTRGECERIVHAAARQGLFGGASRWLGDDALAQGVPLIGAIRSKHNTTRGPLGPRVVLFMQHRESGGCRHRCLRYSSSRSALRTRNGTCCSDTRRNFTSTFIVWSNSSANFCCS